ncbi:MAG TPA: hypothetical protein VMQ62_08400 [Dongiaceae bacterium]|nr:hypothetical protein [Dongiaceae bacterium]
MADADLPRGLPRWPLVAAAVAALPSFFVPFLSDDWANLRTRARDLMGPTPFGAFRPVPQASFVLDHALWGTWPLPWHLTNLVFVVASTALVMALVQRHLGDRRLAALTGLLFALHPHRIVEVAWIAARGDAIAATFFFAAMLAYDRWRVRSLGLPFASLVLFEAALMSREATLSLPAVLLAIGWARDRRPPPRGEILRGLAPLAAIVLLHFLWLRPLVLGPPGVALGAPAGGGFAVNLLRYAAVAIIPARIDHFLDGPRLLFGIGALGAIAVAAAALLAALLAGAARTRAGRVPPIAGWACLIFVVLALPSLLWFPAWSFLLPGAASALALAALLLATGRRAAVTIAGLLALVWTAASIDHWIGWRAASRASAAIGSDLAAASRQPGVRTLVVANLPRRVRGMPVGMEYAAAIEALGGRPVAVEFVTYLDYPTSFADDLAGTPAEAVRPGPDGVSIDLLVPERLDSRNLIPGPADPGTTIEARYGTIHFLEPNHMRLTIPAPAPGVATYVWQDGRLVALEP